MKSQLIEVYLKILLCGPHSVISIKVLGKSVISVHSKRFGMSLITVESGLNVVCFLLVHQYAGSKTIVNRK